MITHDYQRMLGIFAAASRAVHTGETLDDILETILGQIKEAFNAKGCTIRTPDLSTGQLKLLAATGLSETYLEKGPVKNSSQISEIYENSPVFIKDVQNDPRVQYSEAAQSEGIASILGFPFKIVGSHRMVLRIYFPHPMDLSETDLQFIEALVEQCAIAIRYALLHNRYFETFRQVSSAIHEGTDTAEILRCIVTHVSDIMEAKGSIFWIVNKADLKIEDKVCHGFNYNSLLGVDYQTLNAIFEPAKGSMVFIEDARYDERIPNLERLGKKRVRSITGLPFDIVDPYVGILAVYFGNHRPLLKSEIEFLQALGEQGAISLHKTLRYDENMLATFRQTVEGLALAIEAKDSITHGHSLRVAHYARLTAQGMGLSNRQAETIHRAGLLHDIGKIGMGDKVLERLGRLSAKEMDLVRKHPVIGERIVAPLAFLGDVVPLVRHHHERYDGSGYPDGLKGGQIPLGARILAVCDAFETMITGRPNMPRLDAAQAVERLQQGAGSLFDPEVAETWIHIVKTRPGELSPVEAPTRFIDNLADLDNSPAPKKRTLAASWFGFPTSF